jgi:hypothetical protein
MKKLIFTNSFFLFITLLLLVVLILEMFLYIPDFGKFDLILMIIYLVYLNLYINKYNRSS